MNNQLVRTYPGVPPASVFTSGIGTPIVINDTNGNAYALLNGVVTRLGGFIAETPVTLSGNAISISTTIPAAARQINLMFDSVSTNGASDILIQIGDAGGIETGSYVSESGAVVNASASSVSTSTTGFVVLVGSAAQSISGNMVLNLTSSNTWIESHAARTLTTICLVGGGRKQLSDTLTSIQASIVGGVNTFDTGTITVSYQ